MKGLIVGVANEQSLAWGCGKALHAQGAEIALTYLNDKAKPYIAPLAAEIGAPIFMPLNVQKPEELDALFAAIVKQWGRLDFLIHSIAFAPKADLERGLLDASLEGFLTAMDISCHSLLRLTRAAVPLMPDGGAVLCMSYYGAEKVIDNYNLMGPVKAALESSVRYLAAELGPKSIRVNALSPGPVKTRAASGLAHFDALMEKAAREAPLHQLVSIDQVGEAAAFLCSDKARFITGQTIFVDGGFNIKA